MKSYSSVIDDIVISSEVSQKNIAKLDKALSLVNKYLTSAKKELGEARDAKNSDLAFSQSLSEALSLAKRIYMVEVRKAISFSKEFSRDPFKSALLELGDIINDFISVIPRGTGWSRNAEIIINMDEMAGDLEDYALAVTAAREALRVNPARDHERASKYWKTQVFGTPKYDKTLFTRFSNLTSRAPFWSLLNYGNISTSMSSDIGGTPYPRQRGHRFVQHAEDSIYKKFREEFIERRARNKELRSILIAEVRELTAKKKSIKSTLSELSLALTNRARATNIANKLGVTITDKDADRLITALNDYKSQSRSGKSRVSLGGKRPTISRLAELDE